MSQLSNRRLHFRFALPANCLTWLAYAKTGTVDKLGAWNDSSGNSKNATLYGDANVTTAGLQLDGTGDFGSVGNSLNSSLRGEMTVCFWFKANSDYTTSQWMMGNLSATANYCSFGIIFGQTDNEFAWSQNGNVLDSVSTVSLSNNNWHHVVAVRSGSTDAWHIQWYFDGIPDDYDAVSGNPAISTSSLAIGRPGDYVGAYLKGAMDDVMLFNRALAAAEISSIYNNSPGTHK